MIHIQNLYILYMTQRYVTLYLEIVTSQFSEDDVIEHDCVCGLSL